MSRKAKGIGEGFQPSGERRRAYRRALWYIQRHYSPEVIARLVGVHDNTARRWYAEYWFDRYPQDVWKVSGGGRHTRTVAHALMLIRGLPVEMQKALIETVNVRAA